jgi:hypothetical protein
MRAHRGDVDARRMCAGDFEGRADFEAQFGCSVDGDHNASLGREREVFAE